MVKRSIDEIIARNDVLPVRTHGAHAVREESKPLDRLDIRIISLLQDDGMATNAGIARQVGVSEETVRRRVKRLMEDKYIKVIALPDPAKLGFNSEVLIGIQV